MRKITKSTPPESLLTFIKKTNPEDPLYKPTYDGLDAQETNDLKKSLLNEQGWVCAYCMQQINEANMTIEHHCEQTICNGQNGTQDKTLDYTNMLAVCRGKRGKEIHCDTKKSQFGPLNGLPMKILPLNQAHMSTVEYTSVGYIKSSNTIFEDEINKFLNLNTPYLRDLRSKKFKQIFAASRHPKKSIQMAKMKSILDKDLQIGSYKFPSNFPGLSEYMLKEYC